MGTALRTRDTKRSMRIPRLLPLVGLLAALASSWTFRWGRAWLGQRTGLPDPVVALGEDALAITVALAATAPVETRSNRWTARR